MCCKNFLQFYMKFGLSTIICCGLTFIDILNENFCYQDYLNETMGDRCGVTTAMYRQGYGGQ